MKDILYNILAGVGQSMSPAAISGLGRVMGAAFWRAASSRRRLAIKTISDRLEMPVDRAEVLARQSFSHNMASFLEIFQSNRFDHRFIRECLEFDGQENFKQMCDTPRPVVVATAHLGAWEMMTGFGRLYMGTRRNVVVVRRPKDEALNRIMTRLRANSGVEVIEHRRAAFKVLKVLKKKGAAAFLVDHNCSRDEAIFLPFLGKIAAVNVGPALLAVRAKALIFPAAFIRLEEGRYLFHVQPPLDTAELEGGRDDKIRTAAEFYTRGVESMVRTWPEQWFWMHKRWKTRPVDVSE